MALTGGARLGPYEILSALGAGGMGEVYRARDTTLGRHVAIKILPPAVSADPGRRARFEREARLLAALNHPHIGGIYGVEDCDGAPALVLELVQGDTLAGRLLEGPLPVKEALPIAQQIADALDAAHEKGITHRDLKPSNIQITHAGTVKVLDFGLAKAASSDVSERDLTQSPTVTISGTGGGVILGTAAYMSPEQARGQAVDKRTDIWAFGCVVYEMLTGQAVFAGSTVSDTIAAILGREPEWSALPSATPTPIRRLLHRCMEKDATRRLRDIGDARVEIDDVLAGTPEEIGQGPVARRVPIWRRALQLSFAALAGAAAATTMMWATVRPSATRVLKMTVSPSSSAALSIGGSDRDISVTPDGTRIVYIGNSATQLFVRSLTQFEPAALLSASRTLSGVFTSSDGDWIGFVEGTNTLRKVATTGGPAITLLTMDGNSLVAVWGTDNRIVFATANEATGLQRVPAEPGAAAEVLSTPEPNRGEADHLWPEILPNGRGVLFTITAASGGLDNAQIAVLDPSTRTIKTILRGGHDARYVRSGHLVYAANNALRAVAFDLDRLEVRGTPVPAVPRLVTTTAGAADFAMAADGTLVYVDAPIEATGLVPVWVDRQGHETSSGAPPGSYQYPRLIPNGEGIALNMSGGQSGGWVWDLFRSTLRPQPGDQANPVWSADGARVVFASRRDGGGVNLYLQDANGSGVPERLTESPNTHVPTSITPDGRSVVFHEIMPAGDRDLRLVSLLRSRKSGPSEALIATPFDERNGIVSPDGRWLAYESDKSGQLEIYVRPFPGVDDGEWRVSTGGGRQPVWTRNGNELFYVARDGSLLTVSVESRGSAWSTGALQKLLDNRYFSGGGVPRQYDVAPDGQRLLVLKQAGDHGSPQIFVVLNWHEELKRLVPTN